MKRIIIAIIVVLCFGVSQVNAQINAPTRISATQWQWQESGNLLGWKPANFKNHDVVDHLFKGLTTYDSRLLSPLLTIDTAQYTALEFRIKSDVSGSGEFYFRHPEEKFSDDRKFSFTLIGDNQFHVYKIDLSWHAQWKGAIEQLRFDPLNPANAHIELQYLRLIPRNSGGLIANGGFSLRDVGSNNPQNWTFSNVTSAPLSIQNADSGVHLAAPSNSGKITSARFEFPVTGLHQLSVKYSDLEPSKALHGKMYYYDIFSQPLNVQPIDIDIIRKAESQQAESTFTVPDLAAYGQFELIVPAFAQMALENVALQALPPAMPSIKPWEERWQAQWITATDAATQPEAARYFRHSFFINKLEDVTSAKIQVTADNTARVVINGQELPPGINWNEWKLVDIYNIKNYLQQGENVIGIITHNHGSVEGALAELNVQTTSGEITINTDKSWLTFVGNVDNNWSKSTFDAIAWKSAQELGTPNSDKTWGEIPYTYLGHKTALQVREFATVDRAELGQNVTVNLRVAPLENEHRAAALKLGLAATPQSENVYDFPLIPLDTSQWTAGKEVNLTRQVQLPKYFTPGKYFLTAKITFYSLSGNRAVTRKAIEITKRHIITAPTTKVIYLPGNIPAFKINGNVFPVMHTMSHVVDFDMHKSIVKNSHDNGINLLWVNIPQGFDWQPNAPTGFAKMDEILAATLEANLDAYIVLNVPLDPSYNPGMRKWIDLHADQLVQQDDGSTKVGGYNGSNTIAASYASPVWKSDASTAWRELIRHVRSSSYGDRVIGYVPISGISWEWFYWGAQSREFVDYSAPFTQAFAAWAKEQYKGDLARLNKVWKTSYASFDEIKLPTKEERSAADYGVFLDPQKRGAVIDLREFFTQIISDDILNFCHIVKEETDGTAICGTYYGYVMYLGRPYFGVHSGHYALEKVLLSPDIDFVMSPSRYEDRGLGGGSGFMTVSDSVKLHGKLYIDQADIRTLHSDDPTGKLNNLKDSVAVLNREFANGVVNGVAGQWYDFGKGWIAGDKRLMQAVGRMHQIETTLQQTPRDTRDPQNSIAVINGEKSILYTKVDSGIHDTAVNKPINQLNRSGVAWDAYLLNDLPKIKGYRYYLFLNCFNITDAQKEYIDANLKKDGNVLVWIFAPGIITNNSKSTFAEAVYDVNRVSEITGFNLSQIEDGPLRTVISGSGDLLANLAETTFGDDAVNGPRFATKEGIALGHFVNSEKTSFAVKHFDDWTSIYSAAPNPPAAVLRNIAKWATVPVVNEADGDITYISKSLFAVHSLAGGERTFTVSEKYQHAEELFHQQSYAIQNGQLKVVVPEGETMLFLLK